MHIVCYGPPAVSTAANVPAWLKRNRGDATQEALASDIERVTGWHITRDRYSRYESGSLPIGKTVRQHFVDYWASRDVPGPDDQPAPVMAGADGDTTVPAAYLERIDALVTELREDRAIIRELLDLVRPTAHRAIDNSERIGALETAARLADRSAVGVGGGPPARRASAG